MKKLFIYIGLFLWGTLMAWAQEPFFANGADVSWLPQMEASGITFKDSQGQPKDCLLILKELGMNSIRLRVFVNPNNDKTSGHCSTEETVAMALRAQKLGMRILIDFHYSDSWADPAKQNKPKAWENLAFPQLCDAVYQHTHDVLSALNKAGITPDWVQIGNEIPGGMLWPDGSTQHWNQLAQLLNKGYDATKAVNPSIKVIVHVDEGNNREKFNAFFDQATQHQVRYDIIGLSYYPFWIKKDYTETINDLETNLITLSKKYNKDVMIVEVGGEVSKIDNTFQLLKATLNAVRKVPNHRGLGVFYWEPQGTQSWSHYSLNAWLENGQPSPALDAFKN
ncbi:MAG: arabinogalactan endo-beta-1,4-galactanase [Flavobacterium sp.]|jgi:arabinogalactan endo-1,4-beta-galactosidase|uniref:glycoside hydrolase family 53 protein n=1 Tax=Flavobacterium sp. TaxID=239 RepID=UPI0022C47A79|nr:glycosyl hydrolase 53 family protein [Flavobacterium sp.]MCZ8168146.1 glycosyl hydrolase 53 family protein [Flavobacterium sp.]MCZ8296164.1 glycosyl hydrolase 53 family protein [Flavobacterium sp.]